MKKLALEGGKPFIKKEFDLGATYFKEEIKAVNEVLSKGTISGFVANSGPKFYGGNKVKELESSFKNYFNSKFAVASNSATSSLHCALSALGISKGDEVIIPSLSMSASATSIVMTGAKPVFIDICKGDCISCSNSVSKTKKECCFNIKVEDIEACINSKTKAILVVHLFGRPANMKEIHKIAKKYNLMIVEDCAQSPGAKYNHKYVGTFGDIGVFSFNQSKTISSGEGGVAITNDKKLALRMALMRNHAEAMIEDFPEAEMPSLVGFNYRLTELEASVALEQFKKLDKFNRKKIDLANRLSRNLDNTLGIRVLGKIKNSSNVVFIYPLVFEERELKTNRKNFVDACNAEGVPMVEGYTKPLPELPLFKPYSKRREFPNAHSLHFSDLISIKFCHHHNVSIKDIDLLSDAIKYVVKSFL